MAHIIAYSIAHKDEAMVWAVGNASGERSIA
jgi:hypothetical protein